MLKAQPQPTLLVFTLGARAEQRRRRLLPGALADHERSLHQSLLDSVLAAGRESGCRLLVSCPETLALPSDAGLLPQRGESFGERLFHALQMAARESSGPIVLVGSDVPGLTSAHLKQALAALDGRPEGVVIGPSPDGGIYLMASCSGPKEFLRHIPWCRRETRKTLLRELRRRGLETLLLDPLLDLDHRQAFAHWLSRLAPRRSRWRALAAQLSALLSGLLRPLPDPHPRPPWRRAVPVLAGRAPPTRR